MFRSGLTNLTFLSTVGADDLQSTLIEAHFGKLGLTNALKRSGTFTTATYSSIESKEELVVAAADMEIIENEVTYEWLVTEHAALLETASAVVLDGNLAPADFEKLVDYLYEKKVPMIFDPTSTPKATRINLKKVLPKISLVSPNLQELTAMAAALNQQRASKKVDDQQKKQGRKKLAEMVKTVLQTGVSHLLIKSGEQGVIVASQQVPNPSEPIFKPVENIVSVNGAGDTLLGALLANVLKKSPKLFEMNPAVAHEILVQAIPTALDAVALTLASEHPVSPLILPPPESSSPTHSQDIL